MLRKVFIVLCITGVAAALSAFKGPDPVTSISLKNQSLKITPKEFYISAVTDGRSDEKIVGTLQPFADKTAGKTIRAYAIKLKGGFTAIESFMSSALPVNKSYRPVIARLNTLKVTETPVSGGTVKGDIKLSVAFYLQKSDEPIHLVDYNTTTTYQRRPGPATQIEPLISSALGNSLVYLNDWMNAHVGDNINLAKAVKIKFTEYTEPVEGDTIYYNVNRPLQWADFKGRKQPGSRYAAEIFAGLGYDQDMKLVNSVINVAIAMKVYAPKSACWVNPDVLNNDNLMHEQHHFDIARLVAEHFKQKINTAKLTPDNYEATINMAYIDALREMANLQKQYDAETAHSVNKYQQQLWNSRIDKELAEFDIKTNAL